VPYVHDWFGETTGAAIIDWSVPLAILFAIPVMIGIGVITYALAGRALGAFRISDLTAALRRRKPGD